MHFSTVAARQSSHKLCRSSRLQPLAEHSLCVSHVGKRAAPAHINSQGSSVRWGLSPGDGQNHSPISHQTMLGSLVSLYYFSVMFLRTIDFAYHNTFAQTEWSVHREYSSTCVCTPFVTMQIMMQSERQGQIMYLGAGCEPLQATLINY